MAARQVECEHADRKHYAFGLCSACYRRHQRRADPEFTRREHERQKARQARKGLTEADRHRAWYFRKVYGITQEDYDALLAAQGGLCKICGCLPNGRGLRLHVDHCHASGVVRGLLCGSCNTAIGLLKDDPDLVHKVAEYLTQARS